MSSQSPSTNFSLAKRSFRTRLAAFGLQYIVGKGYCALLFLSRQVRGLENLPPGGKIIAPNHPNASDPFHMFATFPRLLSLVQADILDVFFIGWTLKDSGQIAVDEPRKMQAYELGCRALEEGRTVMIFPEGVLNPDGKILKAGTGPIRMSLETGAPIVPFGIYVDPRNTILIRQERKGRSTRVGRWQFRGTCYMQAGEAWYPAREQTGASPPDVYELTDEMMTRVRAAAKQACENSLVGRPTFKLIPG